MRMKEEFTSYIANSHNFGSWFSLFLLYRSYQLPVVLQVLMDIAWAQ